MKEQLLLVHSYLHGIWQYRWSALVISCVVSLLGWAVVYALPNQYTSRAIMQVDTRTIMTPLLKGLAVESSAADGLDIMSRVLLSRKNLEEVIRQTDMDIELNNTGDMNGFVNELARSIILKDTNPKKKNKKNNNNNVYELSYQGDSPELVYQIVSKLLNTLIENTLDSVRTDTAGAQLFLEQQITEYERRLSAAEQKLAEFKRANIGLMPDETGGYYQRLQREQSALENIRSELRLAERRLSEIRKQLAGETPLLGNDSYSSPQILKLRKYREQLDSLLNQYTEQHPDVQALRATIADVIANENVEEDKLAGAGEAVEFNPVYQELKGEMNKTLGH
jgi:polysaccharide chain length determinant protein (PEP-CTERM system associated)